jgi:putative toxin-antitoxin system antitoxin component (TIGR02293 family)
MPIAVTGSHVQPVEVGHLSLHDEGAERRASELLLKAVEVLGDESKAQAWLVDANASLGDRRPLDLAEASEEGYQEAYAVLGRIEYGIYS